MKQVTTFLIVIITGFILSSCIPNKKPIAVAGPDQIIVLPIDSILLDGSSSSDPDGVISSWFWKKISGPPSFNILAPSSSKTSVRNMVAGTYLFGLTVTDNEGLFEMDIIQITVVSTPGNQRPIANAGPDQTITLPTNSVIIDGSSSTDPDNNITSYEWTKIAGPPSFSLSNANAAQTQLTNLVHGVYEFELKVTDAGGLNDKDTVQVTADSSTSPSLVNIYVAGSGTDGPKYWKNGQAASLNGVGNIWPSSIAVNGSDVHVVGGELGLFWYEESGAYWNNGQSVFTVEPGNLCSVTFDGSDVYVAGYEYNNINIPVAKYWKNGQPLSLTNGSTGAYGYGIAVAGNDVYVAGEESGVAKYWKNGQAVSLPNGTYARSIVVVGNDVYVSGNNGAIAKYWKNGQEFPLTNGATASYANSIAVVGSDVYVAGWEGDYYSPVAKYWKNGQAISLGTSPSYAWSIAVHGNNVYVAGAQGNLSSSSIAVYWKNGLAVPLANGSRAMSIVLAN